VLGSACGVRAARAAPTAHPLTGTPRVLCIGRSAGPAAGDEQWHCRFPGGRPDRICSYQRGGACCNFRMKNIVYMHDMKRIYVSGNARLRS